MDLQFTGERLIPGQSDPLLEEEHRARYRLAAEWLTGRQRVLDFGCGEGYGTEILQDGGADSVFGTDIAIDTIVHGRRRYGSDRRHFTVTDCQRSCLRDQSFDGIVALEVIEHVRSPHFVLEEARRLLTKDGLLVVSTPDKKVYSDETGFENPFHHQELYPEELEALVAEYFPYYLMAVQTLAEGQGFFAEPATPAAPGRLVPPVLDAPPTGPYLLVCASQSPLPPRIAASLPAVYLGRGDENFRLRRSILRLHGEFEERSAWALDLNRQLNDRNERILALQKEFEERSAWALSLNEDNQRLRRLSEEQAEEIRRLEGRLQVLSREMADLETS